MTATVARVIKMSSRNALGAPVLFLGLSGENVTRLVAGESIIIRAADMQAMGLPPMDIGIHYGRTEEAIIAEIKATGVTVREGPVPPPGS